MRARGDIRRGRTPLDHGQPLNTIWIATAERGKEPGGAEAWSWTNPEDVRHVHNENPFAGPWNIRLPFYIG